jgi:hypothetical protein
MIDGLFRQAISENFHKLARENLSDFVEIYLISVGGRRPRLPLFIISIANTS